jgi:hypothetical protein
VVSPRPLHIIFIFRFGFSIRFRIKVSKSKWRYPCYRPWRPIGLREVKATTCLRQTASRWLQGCQPYAPAALYPQVSLFFKDSWYSFLLEAESTRGPVRPEGLVNFRIC